MTDYQLIDARLFPNVYAALFAEYCAELLTEDPALAQYDPAELAAENLQSPQDHPCLIQTESAVCGLVVFMDEANPAGESDCRTYIGEMYVKKPFRRRGLAGQITADYLRSLRYDTGLCCIRGSAAERYWLKLIGTLGYTYTVFREDDIRDFVHIHIRKRNTALPDTAL